jgi:hypothetical protein
MIISIVTKKAFDIINPTFMIKAPNKVRTNGRPLNIMEGDI